MIYTINDLRLLPANSNLMTQKYCSQP
eukprot:UN14398